VLREPQHILSNSPKLESNSEPKRVPSNLGIHFLLSHKSTKMKVGELCIKNTVRFLSFDTVKNAFKDPETGALSPMLSR
jgi:hypothetical protein